MKDIFKLSLSLFGNQILASVAGFMCVLFVWMLAGESILSQIIFMCFTIPFFIYIEYRAAFNYGFHNPNRRCKKHSKAYLYNGAIAGVISAIPLYALIITHLIATLKSNIYLSEITKLYSRMLAMYYNWPMCNIFPNHDTEVLISSMLLVVIFPTLGYIAGYKNIVISDSITKFINSKTKV